MIRLLKSSHPKNPRRFTVSGFAVLFSALLLFCGNTLAKGVYQTGPEFIASTFEGSDIQPSPKIMWLTQERKQQVADILGHPVHGFRVRYWQGGERTAWILDEIGKEQPITVGVVIANNEIQQVKILTYRESRGGEVRFPRFLSQFSGGKLNTKQQLSVKIDGITGATLSVRAVKNVSRLALYYHQLATDEQPQENNRLTWN